MTTTIKNFLVLFATVLVFNTVFSQSSISSNKKLPSLGGSIFIKDFPDAAKLFKLNHYDWSDPFTVGLSGQFITGLTNSIDLVASTGATITQYKSSTGYFYYQDKNTVPKQHKLLLDFESRLNFKLLPDEKPVVPYFTAGLGFSAFNFAYTMAYVPLGAGLQFNLKNDYFLYSQLILQEGLTNNAKHNFDFSVGFSMPIKKRITPIVTPKVEVDRDGDGIPDSKDSCPTVAGLLKYHGCPIPDTDKDGINDEEDSCPTVPGIAKYHGCPIPDTDKDGINDMEDSCPTIPGLARYHGCPIPDTDGDGVNDEEDKCPTEKGTIENKGCPEIQTKMNELAKNIFFNSGSSVINPKALPILDQVISIMYKYPLFKLEVEGHTDNVGSPILNQKMSQRRADAIKAYLIGRGIQATRLYSIGYGFEKPIASNKTATGRALNRRVELHAKY